MATIPANRQIIGKLFISRPDGMTYEDISDYLCSAEIELGDVSSVGTGATGADGVVRQMTFSLHNDKDIRFSPRDKVSPINQFNAQYSPLLWPMRKVYLRTAIIGNQESGTTCRFNREIGVGDGSAKEFSLGIAPILQDSEKIFVNDIPASGYQINYAAGTVIFIVAPASGAVIKADYTYYHTVFTGYLGDDIQPEGSIVTCQCRDLAKRLQKKYIETPRTYGSDEGVPAETVIQQILDDNFGAGEITLYTPASPGFLIKPYILEYKSVWDALQEIVAQFGWFVGYSRDESTNEFQLTLLEPPRNKDSATADFTLDYEDDFYKNSLSFNDNNIRNVVKITYFDKEKGKAVTLLPDDADNAPYLKDQTSIDEYGRMAMEIAEKDTSLIDTKEEALEFGAALINDLKDIGATDKINMPFLPQMDVFSGINVIDPRYSSTTDFFGVESVRHTLDFKNGKFRTEIVGSGRVVGARQKWLRMQTRPGAGEPIRFRNILERNANIIIAAPDTPYAKKKLADYVCDGVADQVQIIDAIGMLPDGGKILLLEGTYVTDDPIYLQSKIKLEGQGRSTILKSSTAEDIIYAEGYSDNKEQIIITSLAIDGSSGVVGIAFNYVNDFIIDNVLVSNTTGIALHIMNSSEGIISNCKISGPGDGIFFSYGNGNTVSNCMIKNCKIGVKLSFSDNSKIKNCTIENNQQHGVYAGIALNNLIQGNFISGNSTDTNNKYSNIYLFGEASKNNIQNNIVRIGDNVNKPKYGIDIYMSNNVDNFISNNDLRDSGLTGSIHDNGTNTILTPGNQT